MGAKDGRIAREFGALLRELRTKAGLTMAEFGGRVEPPMHAQAVARYEAGRTPALDTLYRLAAALAVHPSALLPEPHPKGRRK